MEYHDSEASTRQWAAGAAVPMFLVAAAAVVGLSDGRAGESAMDVARVAAVAASVTGGTLVATAVLRIADRGPSGQADDVAADGVVDDGLIGDATTSVSDPRTLRGGTSIGILERIAVATTLLAGWPEGLALVLGVKGLGRYPELRRPVAAERFIIGTLASVLWAVAVVGATLTLES